MAIEAPYSKYNKTNFKIAIIVLVGMALWFAYDGYLSDSYREKHTNSDGTADSSLVFNRKAPFFLAGAAIVLVVWFGLVKDKKVVADEKGLVLNEKEEIAYDSIEKIDRTYFEPKGYFVITYKDDGGNEVERKLSNRTYDNIEAVLSELVGKINS